MKAMLLKGKNQPFVLENMPDPVPGPDPALEAALAALAVAESKLKAILPKAQEIEALADG